MPHTISLVCFSKDFQTSTNIDINKLSAVIRGDQQLRIEEEEGRPTLFVRQDDGDVWLPLLWLAGEKSYINSSPVFELGLYHELAEIAEKLGAAILSEEGLILFLPGEGLLLDPETGIDKTVSLSELQSSIRETGNTSRALEAIRSGREVKDPPAAKASEKSGFEKFRTSRTANILAVILVIIFCIILLWKKK